MRKEHFFLVSTVDCEKKKRLADICVATFFLPLFGDDE